MLNINNVATAALALSDNTPVEFVKVTSKGNVQVRVPADHALGNDPLRIFRPDGSHYKSATDLRLIVANDTAATPISLAKTPAPVAIPAPVATTTTYEVDGQMFDNLADAKSEAMDLFREGDADLVEIFAITRTVVGKVGFVEA